MKTGIHKYAKPSVTVDVVMFRVRELEPEDKRKVGEKVLEVLVIEREKEPGKGKLALPGGFVSINEELETKVESVLKDKVGIKRGYYIEQLETRGGLNRDSRGRVISVSYIGLSHISKLEYTEIKENVKWVELKTLLEKETMAFDHKDIIATAYSRLQSKVGYTDVGLELLPGEFTLRELQDVFILLGHTNVKNLRRELHIPIEETGEKTEGTQYRPAKLYRRG